MVFHCIFNVTVCIFILIIVIFSFFFKKLLREEQLKDTEKEIKRLKKEIEEGEVCRNYILIIFYYYTLE